MSSRRLLLQALLGSPVAAGLLTMPAVLQAAEHAASAHHDSQAFTTLAEDEAEEFAAIASRILPSDETPGAKEGGVVYFIDTVLGSSRQEWLPAMREGLKSLQATVVQKHGVPHFSMLSAAQQDELLHTIEKTEFFDTVRFLTLAGMFTLPEYGGNRDHVGYDLIGFDHRHAWQPPFGYYDGELLQHTGSGE